MKDARGHGSNSHGRGVYLRPDGRSVMPTVPARGSGEYPARNAAANAAAAQALTTTANSGAVPMSSNAQAAQSLMSALKSTMAPVHPAMRFGRRRNGE